MMQIDLTHRETKGRNRKPLIIVDRDDYVREVVAELDAIQKDADSRVEELKKMADRIEAATREKEQRVWDSLEHYLVQQKLVEPGTVSVKPDDGRKLRLVIGSGVLGVEELNAERCDCLACQLTRSTKK